VFTARYALSPYIKQIRSVFKGLMIIKFGSCRYWSSWTDFSPPEEGGSTFGRTLIIQHGVKIQTTIAPATPAVKTWILLLCFCYITRHKRHRYAFAKNSLLEEWKSLTKCYDLMKLPERCHLFLCQSNVWIQCKREWVHLLMKIRTNIWKQKKETSSQCRRCRLFERKFYSRVYDVTIEAEYLIYSLISSPSFKTVRQKMKFWFVRASN
jgi:hypothetical protein